MENVTITMTFEQALSVSCAVYSDITITSNIRDSIAKDDPQAPGLSDMDQVLKRLKAAYAAILEAM